MLERARWTVTQRSGPAPPGSSGGLVESQSEAQRGVDLLQFVETYVADQLPETLGGDGGGLFGEYLGRFVTDGDRGSKDSRRR